MIDLGDDRLNQRLIKISQQILDSPQSNINNACGDWSETKAAYRFFQNDNVNYQDIINAHAQMTKERAKQEETILAIQDTTYFNYTHHPKTEGLENDQGHSEKPAHSPHIRGPSRPAPFKTRNFIPL